MTDLWQTKLFNDFTREFIRTTAAAALVGISENIFRDAVKRPEFSAVRKYQIGGSGAVFYSRSELEAANWAIVNNVGAHQADGPSKLDLQVMCANKGLRHSGMNKAALTQALVKAGVDLNNIWE